MKRIIIVSNDLWNIVNFRRPIINILKEYNYEIHIITTLRNLYKESTLDNVTLHNVNIDRRGINIISEILLIFKLYKIINKIKPELILNFTIKPVIYVSLISRLLKIYTINTITGLGRVFTVKKLFLIKFLVKWLYKISQKNVNQLIFHNSEDYNYFIKKQITSRINSIVMKGSGVNLDNLKYSKPQINKKLTFLTISRLTAEKGIYELIEAIKLIKENTDIEINFLLFGSFEKKTQGGITQKKITQWEKVGLIQYKGFVKNIHDYIKNCDALIHPSHREGSSRSIQESMSLGRPVIASDCKGNLESVIEDYNGYIFKTKDSKSLYKTITKFIKLNKNKRLDLSLNARETAEKFFDEKNVSNFYIKKINNLLN